MTSIMPATMITIAMPQKAMRTTTNDKHNGNDDHNSNANIFVKLNELIDSNGPSYKEKIEDNHVNDYFDDKDNSMMTMQPK